MPKNAFFDCFFFSKISLRRRKFCQNRGKTVLWERSKNQFGRPKKKGRQNSIFFLKIRPPRENPRSAPENRFFIVFWERLENEFGRPKKGRQNFFEFSSKIRTPAPPPQENLRSAPGLELPSPPPSGIRTPANPRVPPWYFLGPPLGTSAPIYTNFEKERAPIKRVFFCQNFPKSAQKRLF